MDWLMSALTANLGAGLEWIIMIVILLGCLVFMAADVKLGVMLLFFSMSCLFMWFYWAGWNWMPVLVVSLASLVLMSLLLYAVSKSSKEGQFV